MAAEVVGGAFLSASLEVLFKRMDSWEFVDFVRRKKIKIVFDEIKFKLLLVSGVLNDAEMKQMTDPSVRWWVDELKDAIYHVEDLVYLIHTKAELERESRTSRRRSKLRKFLPTSCAAKQEDDGRNEIYDSADESLQNEYAGNNTSKVRNDFAAKKAKKQYPWIQRIFFMLELILRKKDHLDLRKGVETRSLQLSSETTLLEERHIYGRDDDRDAIIQLLLSDGKGEVVVGDSDLCVIPIVGMGGIGKTTLAQLVYMDYRINQHFDHKAWITVSHQYDVFTLTKNIYEAVTGSKIFHTEEIFQLQLALKEYLSGKRFLLVLDDVWNFNFNSWCALKSPFEFAAYGSKIIVTTRDGNIASLMGTVPNHSLQLMSDEDCWLLFSKHAFNGVDPSAYPELVVIGRKLVKKCQGLPLAIKSIAGLLHAELNPKKWENILKSDIWELTHECGILSTLWLSYYYLPPHLKRCFAYCSIFPKGYELDKSKLILLWMAEDLLIPKKNKMLEEVGEEHFDDLVSRSFFHKSEMYGFTMHDLVNDLAQYVAGESCLRFNENCSKILLSKTRHLSWMADETQKMRKLEDVSKENVLLRTLLRVDHGQSGINDNFFIHPRGLKIFQCLRVLSLYRVAAITNLLDSIGKLQLLKYLDLSWTEVEQIPDAICSLYNLQTLLLHDCSNLGRLPDSIRNLKHLRCLDLSYTELEEIPDGVCNLLDLHTLLLRSCRKLTDLPINMARLVNLRHLDICATSLREMPPQLSNLRYLKIFSDFVAGTSSESGIKVVGEVQDVRGTLSIRNLEEVINVDDVTKANLKDEKCITELILEWQDDTGGSWKAQEVLNRLKPHTDLERLSVINYGGISFSNWIGDDIFSHLVYMWLSKCKQCSILPPVGQLPSLKSLSIDGFDMVERIGYEFYVSDPSAVTKPFRSLEKLVFKCMPQWKEWSLVEGEVFSQLKELHLMDCPSLTLNETCFPDSLPSLTHLYISKCQQVVASFLSFQLPLLGSLYIGGCTELESFPERRLPTNIHMIEIYGCEELKSFSDEGWPSNLKSLSIGSCEKLFATLMQWSLPTVTSLTSLDLSCIDEVVDSFPEEGQLPTTLTSLTLCRLRNLKSLNGKALRQLASLEELSISYCEQLQCMPQEGLPAALTSLHLSCLERLKSLNDNAFVQLTSLEKLSISYCPLLLCMPEEGLPASLSELTIEWCRFLIPRCQREIGEDWPKIAHIPYICINPN